MLLFNTDLKRILLNLTAVILLTVSLAACGNYSSSELINPDDPVTITVWTYYNGPQLSAFNSLVDLFNKTEGKEAGIIVESHNYGSVEELQERVLDSVNGKVGASNVPDIFSAYADTAYTVDNMGLLADLSPFLSEDERALYIDEYLQEGGFESGTLKIFPIAKSTELLLLNRTDWEPFAQATGASPEDLETWEGLAETAEAYYEWSDGKAFFGRDAMANYFLIGSMQLGTELISTEDSGVKINFDRTVVKKLWDNYYVPFIKGHYAASGRFRSDDVKTGNILCYVGSSSSATYFPDEITINDSDTHEIEMMVLQAPHFKDGENYAVQQGAGMVVTDSSEERVYASVRFLKWFTSPERDLTFYLGSCYMPVTKEAASVDAMDSYEEPLDNKIRTILTAAYETVQDNTLYTPGAFEGGTGVRSILEYAMSDQAVNDRALVLQHVAGGISEEDALSAFLTDDNFDSWYEKTLQSLQAVTH